MVKKKSSHQVEVQESVDKSAKQYLPAKFDARRQLKYNVLPDSSNQIITVYLIGQFKPWKDMISFHCSNIYLLTE